MGFVQEECLSIVYVVHGHGVHSLLRYRVLQYIATVERTRSYMENNWVCKIKVTQSESDIF